MGRAAASTSPEGLLRNAAPDAPTQIQISRMLSHSPAASEAHCTLRSTEMTPSSRIVSNSTWTWAGETVEKRRGISGMDSQWYRFSVRENKLGILEAMNLPRVDP